MARRGKTSETKHPPAKTAATVDPPAKKTKRYLTQGLAILALGALIVTVVLSSQSPAPIGSRPGDENTSQLVEVDFQGDRSTWQLLALNDDELEKVSLVELNLAVVREIAGYEDLDQSKYEAIVDQWAREFAKELPAIDATFKGREAEYNNDLRFYRIGQLMTWLGHKKNIEYIPEQRGLKNVIYKDPAELFLHGLLDTNQGTCGNMPTLQAAIARRMGWPVALAPVENHTVCRFDDGEVAYNIETTHTDKGGFSAGTQADYAKEFNLPACAFTEADTLETMSAREMLAYFIALRGRYYWDTGQWEKADQDTSLARSLLPRHRKILLASFELGIQRSDQLFASSEKRTPVKLAAAVYQHRQAKKQRTQKVHDAFIRQTRAQSRNWQQQRQSEFARIEAINEQNRRRWENPSGFQQPQTNDPYSPFPPPP